MTTKESILAEIEALDAEKLDELYLLVRRFVQSKRTAKKPSLMSKLKSVQIDGPADFAANHDAYINGEPYGDADLR